MEKVEKTTVRVAAFDADNVFHFHLVENRRCYPGWIGVGSSCYRFFVEIKRNWNGARAYCRAMGGDLVAFEDRRELNEVSAKVTKITLAQTSYFVGIIDLSASDRNLAQWVNGKSVDVRLWKSAFSEEGDIFQCGAMTRSGSGLITSPCTNMLGFICESHEGKKFMYTMTCDMI